MREPNERTLCMIARYVQEKAGAPLHVEGIKGVVGVGGCALSHSAVFHNTILLTALS